MKTYSKFGKISHILYNAFVPPALGKRVDLTDPEESLQVSVINTTEPLIVPAHAHAPIELNTHGTTETWIVMGGKGKVWLYDHSHQFITEESLSFGDILITFCGAGHKLITDNLVMVECKNGPYIINNRKPL